MVGNEVEDLKLGNISPGNVASIMSLLVLPRLRRAPVGLQTPPEIQITREHGAPLFEAEERWRVKLTVMPP